MVDASLGRLLEEALPHTPPATARDFALTVLLQEADGGRLTPHPSVTALLEYLRNDPALEIFHGRTQILSDVGKGVTHVFLAEWLLGRAGAVGADQAVKDLERYLRTQRLPCHSIVAVGGIKVDSSYDLGHGMQIVPWKDVVSSRTKRSIDEAESFHRSFYDSACGLLREVELPRTHVHYTEAGQHLQSRDVTAETDLLLCLGLFGPTAPVLLASWLQPPDWAPMITGSLSMPFVEGPGKAKPIPECAIVDASTLFSRWLGLSEERRLELRVPMQRLNSAMRRPSLVDSAIDLGIALESVFLPDGRGALTFRLRVRAARWLGSTPEERKRLSATVADLYSVRSMAVHEGRVPDAIHRRATRELLEEGYELTARALVALISKGDPDWDAVTYG
jgi:hypothetical protein